MMTSQEWARLVEQASTEPRSFERGDPLESRVCRRRVGMASTEPRSFERGDDLGPAHLLIRVEMASTEPRSFERGDGAKLQVTSCKQPSLQRSRALSSAEIAVPHPQRTACELASTEPRSFERGDGPDHRRGAHQLRRASTEPRSFERGDITFRFVTLWPPRLQRSRALSSAEIAARPPCFQPFASLQRSRALSSAEMSAYHMPAPAQISLQRSRALSSAEIRRCRVVRNAADRRFNGAALFRARRLLNRIGEGENRAASTEPRSFERGDGVGGRLTNTGLKCFNGAALFRARR